MEITIWTVGVRAISPLGPLVAAGCLYANGPSEDGGRYIQFVLTYGVTGPKWKSAGGKERGRT